MDVTATDLHNYHIPGTHKAFYVPNFITADEEDHLIRKIRESPRQRWKQLANRRLQLLGGEITSKNVLITQAMPSFIDTYPNLIARLRVFGVFTSSPHGEPNHIILNEYLPGQGIMAHEDGPSYYPVVATISLGSHSVFHYYRYTQCSSGATATAGEGQVIDPAPIHSIFLEPRSLIITMASLYTSHLHGIQGIGEDEFIPGKGGESPLLANLEVPVTNWHLVTADPARTAFERGGVLQRAVRYSLTCRDVERVASPKTIGRR